MEIDKKSETWNSAPWYVKLSAWGAQNTETLNRWATGSLVIGVLALVLVYSGYRPTTLFVAMLGAYCLKSSEVWVLKNQK